MIYIKFKNPFLGPTQEQGILKTDEQILLFCLIYLQIFIKIGTKYSRVTASKIDKLSANWSEQLKIEPYLNWSKRK